MSRSLRLGREPRLRRRDERRDRRRARARRGAVLLLNNDIEVEPGFLEPLVDALGVATITSAPPARRSSSRDDPVRDLVRGRDVPAADAATTGRNRGYGQPPLPPATAPYATDRACGGAMLVTAGALEAVGALRRDALRLRRGHRLVAARPREPGSDAWSSRRASCAMPCRRRRAASRRRRRSTTPCATRSSSPSGGRRSARRGRGSADSRPSRPISRRRCDRAADGRACAPSATPGATSGAGGSARGTRRRISRMRGWSELVSGRASSSALLPSGVRVRARGGDPARRPARSEPVSRAPVGARAARRRRRRGRARPREPEAALVVLARRGVRVTTLDQLESEIEVWRGIAERRAEPELRVGDGRALPFDDESFDHATSISVLEHVAGRRWRRGRARELARCVRPGGRIAHHAAVRAGRARSSTARRRRYVDEGERDERAASSSSAGTTTPPSTLLVAAVPARRARRAGTSCGSRPTSTRRTTRTFPLLVPLGPVYGLLARERRRTDGDVIRLILRAR